LNTKGDLIEISLLGALIKTGVKLV